MNAEILAPLPERLEAAADHIEVTRVRVWSDLVALANFLKRYAVANPQRPLFRVNERLWG